jgi:hypothetical protein
LALDLARRRERRTTDVNVDGDVVKLGFNLSEVTNRNLRLLDTPATSETEERDRMAVYCKIFLDWDLTDGGQPVPLNPDTLAGVVDIFLMRRLLEGVIAASRPPEPTAVN